MIMYGINLVQLVEPLHCQLRLQALQLHSALFHTLLAFSQA